MNSTIKELKQQLHESVENIQDINILNTLKDIADHDYHVLNEPTISEFQRNRIEQSKLQIVNANSFTNEQANELINKWLAN